MGVLMALAYTRQMVTRSSQIGRGRSSQNRRSHTALVTLVSKISVTIARKPAAVPLRNGTR